MNETQEKFLAAFDKRYSRMRNTLITIIGIILAAFLGNWFSTSQSYGQKLGDIQANITEMSNNLKIVSKDYTPAWYMAGITDLYSLSIEKMVVALANDKQNEIRRINEDLKKTVEIMQNNFIQMRGGYTNITRNGKK